MAIEEALAALENLGWESEALRLLGMSERIGSRGGPRNAPGDPQNMAAPVLTDQHPESPA